jgi:carboxypeptidase family protein
MRVCNPTCVAAVQPVLDREKGYETATVNFPPAGFSDKRFRARAWSLDCGRGSLLWVLLGIISCVLSTAAQSPQVIPAENAAAGAETQTQQSLGSISGTIVDATGGAIAGAQVTLTFGGPAPKQDTQSGPDGSFSFASVAPGPFTITTTATGFAARTFSGTLHPGEIDMVPPIALSLATNVTEVRVVVPSNEVAEEQLKIQEKQRVLGVIPNFYVTYIPDAAALSPKQKFELAWRTSIDPVTLGLTAAVAGFQQAEDQFNGYGQGTEGYAKRFGAIYAGTVTGTFIGGAIFPALLKQDPRYFYKGTGSARSRILYAIANAVICKGDNKHWQPNYSSIAGSLAAGGIANLYYPPENRGVALTFENALITIGEGAAGNLFEEFLSRKLTPNLLKHQSAKS